MVRKTQPPSSTSQGSVLSSSAGGKNKSKGRAVPWDPQTQKCRGSLKTSLSLKQNLNSLKEWLSLLSGQPLQSVVTSNRKKKSSDFVETSPSALPSFSSRSGFGMGVFVKDSRGPSSGSLLILDGTLRSKREDEHPDFGHKFLHLHFCTLGKLIHKTPKQISTSYKCHNRTS